MLKKGTSSFTSDGFAKGFALCRGGRPAGTPLGIFPPRRWNYFRVAEKFGELEPPPSFFDTGYIARRCLLRSRAAWPCSCRNIAAPPAS
jgi:hypothetical protein